MVAVAQTLDIGGAPAVATRRWCWRRPCDVALAADIEAELAAEGDGLRRLKLALNTAVDGLRRAERAPRAHDLANTLEDADARERFEQLATAAGSLPDDAARG